MFSPTQSCTERHPEYEVDDTCIACIYYHKRLNRLQKFDLADLVRRLLACIGGTCHRDETCTLSETDQSDLEILDQPRSFG